MSPYERVLETHTMLQLRKSRKRVRERELLQSPSTGGIVVTRRQSENHKTNKSKKNKTNDPPTVHGPPVHLLNQSLSLAADKPPPLPRWPDCCMVSSGHLGANQSSKAGTFERHVHQYHPLSSSMASQTRFCRFASASRQVRMNLLLSL